jgi:phage gp45-like
VTGLVPLMAEVARRELAAHRGVALGVVDTARTNDGGSAEHHLECDVRLHGSGLVLQDVPVAVARPGLSVVPRAGDLVVLGFVDGDVNGAVVLGTLHAAGIPSPDAKPEEVVYEVPDSDGDRRLQIKLPNGSTLTVTDDSMEIAMGSTKVTVETDGGLTVDAAGDVSIKANGSLTLEATSSATLKGASVTVEGSGSATLKGGTTTIAGTTSFSAG